MNGVDALGYFIGQCTDFVASALGWIPAGLGNAGEWLANAQAKGLPTSSAPEVGAVAVYAPGGGYSSYGHVAVVTAINPDNTFQVQEENFSGGPGAVDTRTSTMADVEGFILPPGGGGSPTPATARTLSNPSPGAIGSAVGAGLGLGILGGLFPGSLGGSPLLQPASDAGAKAGGAAGSAAGAVLNWPAEVLAGIEGLIAQGGAWWHDRAWNLIQANVIALAVAVALILIVFGGTSADDAPAQREIVPVPV